MSIREITIIPSNNGDDKHRQKTRYLKVKCEICKERFSQIGSLYQHRKRKHNISGKNYNGKTCPLCFESNDTRKTYEKHLLDAHQQELQYESWQFDSMQDFHSWKEQMEKETISFFSHKSGQNSIYNYFYCNRTGKFKSQCSTRENGRLQGSRKIGAVCPAMIKLKCDDKNGKFLVNFCSTHLGHDKDIHHLNHNRRPEGFKSKRKSKGKTNLKPLDVFPVDISLIDHDYCIPEMSESTQNKAKRSKSTSMKSDKSKENPKQEDDLSAHFEDDLEMCGQIETVFSEETTEEEMQKLDHLMLQLAELYHTNRNCTNVKPAYQQLVQSLATAKQLFESNLLLASNETETMKAIC